MFEWVFSLKTGVSLFTLTALEIVLGLDNLVFISLLTQGLAKAQQKRARQWGLVLACLTRLLLLTTVMLITGFTEPLLNILGYTFSWRDLILVGGGIFLLEKGTRELHLTVSPLDEKVDILPRTARFWGVIVQIMLMDILFSLDSVITAVGMAQEFIIMALAIMGAMGLMIWVSGPINRFISDHPNLKILGLSFLLLVGFILIAEGFGMHVPRGYLYFAISFSVFVEWMNILAFRWRHRKK